MAKLVIVVQYSSFNVSTTSSGEASHSYPGNTASHNSQIMRYEIRVSGIPYCAPSNAGNSVILTQLYLVHEAHVDGYAGLNVCCPSPERVPTAPNGKLACGVVGSHQLDKLRYFSSSSRSEDTIWTQSALMVTVVG